MRLWAILTFAALAAPALFGQLTWERTAVELSAAVGEEYVVVEFPFANRSGAPVEVLALHAECGCTVPELDRKIYAPGESGVLKATFAIESRQGRQEKSVQVQTDAGATELKFVVHVPVRLEISPRLLAFAGAKTEEKRVHLKFSADTPVQEIALASVTGPFAVELVTVDAGRNYELRVRPNGPEGVSVTGAVVLRSKGASGAEHFDTIFLRRQP